MEKLTVELDVQNAVCFAGRLDWSEVPEYIAGFDVGYVENHLREIGFMYHSALKLYKYMAMARSVIASEYANAKEILISGQHGYLIEPGEIEDLKRILRRAHEDRQRWNETGNAAREHVIQRAGWQARVKNMMAGIQRIL